jgi:plastocyanin
VRSRPQLSSPRGLYTALILIGALALALALATGAGAADTTVEMRDNAFIPESITVQAGDTVTWTSHDPEAHTVTFLSGPEKPGSGELNDGQSFTHTFRLPGDYSYTCGLHANMNGSLTVQAAAGGSAQPSAQPATAETSVPLALVGVAVVLVVGAGALLVRRAAVRRG